MDKSTDLSPEDILNFASLKELFGGFAHEIAQPLNAIMIASQVIQFKLDRTYLTEEEKGFLKHRLNIVTGQVQKAIEIIESLRAFVKGERTNAKPLSIKQALEKVHGLMGQQFVGRGIDVELDLHEHVSEEYPLGKPNLVENVIVQALAYSRDTIFRLGQLHDQSGNPYTKKLQVRLIDSDIGATVSLSWKPEDTGVAIPEEIGAHLGLQTASTLLTDLGGSVEVSAAGVIVTFPRSI
jgi:signal transduction histidine kinase